MNKVFKVMIPAMIAGAVGVVAFNGVKKYKKSKKMKEEMGEFWKYDEAWTDDDGLRNTASIVNVGGKLVFNATRDGRAVTTKGDKFVFNTVKNGKATITSGLNDYETLRKFDAFVKRVWEMGIVCKDYDTSEGSFHGIGAKESKGILTFANGVKLEVPCTELFVEAEVF